MNSSKAIWVALVAAFAVIAFQQVQIGRLKKLGGAEAPEKARDDGDLEARLDEIEERVQRLGRIAIAESRSGGSTLSEEEIEALKEDVSAVAADRALTSGAGREKLRSAIREEQEALEEERRQDRTTRMNQLREERLAKFITDARLSESQVKVVTDASGAEAEKMQTLFEDVRGGAKSWQDVRPEMRTMRDATDELVKQTVDSQQYAVWEAMRQENRRGQDR